MNPFSTISRLIVLILLAIPSIGIAQRNFDFTSEAEAAYDLVLSLQFEEAKEKIAFLKHNDPENLIPYFIENYIDFFTVFISEDEAAFKRLEKNKDTRLQKIKKGDPTSPYYNYCQAEINLQWALARLKFEQYFNAFSEVKNAYKLLNKNEKKYPDFIANKKSLGILHAIIGTVPDNYQWGVKLLSGMSGSIQQGKDEIEEVLRYAQNNDFIFEEESLVMYSFLLLHLNNQQEEAWRIIRSGKLDPATNPLATFVLANVAMHTGRNDEAIDILMNKPVGNQYFPFQYLDYLLGLSKLSRTDDDADVYLKKYTNEFQGVNYIKEAYQKLAWHELLKDNRAGYDTYIQKCLTEGEAVIGGDKNAKKEAKNKIIPDPILLRARILFDGGYYERAYDLLNAFSPTYFPEKRHQLELNYRLGRITHKRKRFKEALEFYQKTIENGRSDGYYYACNAALQQGLIYESLGDKVEAKKAYQLCLSMRPDEYKSGLHQQAKSGLNRLDE